MMIKAKSSVVFLLFSILTTALSNSSKSIELETPQGRISGTSEVARNGRTFYSFRGIPFAKPPTGKMRFMDPEAADNWSGVRNGSWVAPECPQPESMRIIKGLPMDEDCLYLNVFTPNTNSSTAVMVYIHGGGFGGGSMILRQPHFLLSEEIVLVTIQYRVGLLGFLSTEDEVVPGNMGLKDQTLALHWLKNNIKAYGGDPQQVTLFGMSAGGISGHFQMFIPAARGLFNRVIIQSNVATTSGVTKEGGFRQHAQKLGQLFNCTVQESEHFNSTELISCLQEIPAIKFTQPEARNSYYHFAMRPDGEYLPATPKQLLVRGDYYKCDIMAGFTQHEAGMIVIAALSENKTQEDLVKKDLKPWMDWMLFDEVPGGNVAVKKAEDDQELNSIFAKALQYYVGQQNITSEQYDQVVRLVSSSTALSHDQVVQLHARDTLYNKKIFAYELKHPGQPGQVEYFYPNLKDRNVTIGKNWVFHGDDLKFLFPLDSINVTLKRPEDIKMSEVMVKLWTNFAMHGNPTPDDSLGFTWSPVSLSSQRQQLVLKPKPYMENNDRCKDLEFWQSLPNSGSFIITEQKCEDNTMCIEFHKNALSVRKIYWRRTLSTPLFQNNLYSQEELLFPNSPEK